MRSGASRRGASRRVGAPRARRLRRRFRRGPRGVSRAVSGVRDGVVRFGIRRRDMIHNKHGRPKPHGKSRAMEIGLSARAPHRPAPASLPLQTACHTSRGTPLCPRATPAPECCAVDVSLNSCTQTSQPESPMCLRRGQHMRPPHLNATANRPNATWRGARGPHMVCQRSCHAMSATFYDPSALHSAICWCAILSSECCVELYKQRIVLFVHVSNGCTKLWHLPFFQMLFWYFCILGTGVSAISAFPFFRRR